MTNPETDRPATVPPPMSRAAKAEALLLRFTAEAHRRKWNYDRGLDGDGVPVKSEAFDALHRLGEEMRVALEELRRMPAAVSVPPPATRADAEPEFQVWPLQRVLTEVRCGSQDWSWEEEWADLDRRHAETGYLAKLEQQIRANGITMPVLIGSDGRLWDGHHRLRLAVRLGIGYVPVEITPRRAAAVPGPVAGEQQNETPEARQCACPHPADEHSVYGCADGCGCEWMPKRAAKGA